MNTELKKTLAFVAVALVLTGAAVVRRPGQYADSAFSDQGRPFFPDFKDPLAATDLEVMEYDPSTATSRPFKIMFRNGRWVIPSHHDYPADAKDRLAKTAASVIDLNKDTVRSDRAEDHEALGVLDPRDPKAGLKGRGKRVTLKDRSEQVLADLIIGNEVKDHPDQRYVRLPGQKRVYGVNVKADLSTRFADWIETNLLKLDAARLRSVKIDHQHVDPDQRTIVPGEVDRVERNGAGSPWSLDGGIPEGMELNADKLSALTSALADLKIVGVRPKPEGISRELKIEGGNEVKPTTTAVLQSLASKGFWYSPSGKDLYSNQGEVVASTEDGAIYTLRFGEVVFATGEELTSGPSVDAAKAKEAEAPKKNEGTVENRYLMVTVAFDPKLVPEPVKPKEVPAIPDDPFQKAPDDPKRIAEEKAVREKADREKAERDKQLADAEAKVKALSDRFADWYYVTTGDSFRAISLTKADLLRPKTAAKPGGADALPGGDPHALPGGLPEGLIPNFPGR